ncbi:hypothetical protein BofuT4_P006740.1 [Botrytis cinerea T4]|uniref:Uncharacterized protein n=1 Tax=Botryotinia fuckeliana (strain T4) TaxID=999810 RepID=G2Y4C5_BOTF4|nr:hypothetical protein BofuT4_P006740.1 [Botrytis cinerea T4]
MLETCVMAEGRGGTNQDAIKPNVKVHILKSLTMSMLVSLCIKTILWILHQQVCEGYKCIGGFQVCDEGLLLLSIGHRVATQRCLEIQIAHANSLCETSSKYSINVSPGKCSSSWE